MNANKNRDRFIVAVTDNEYINNIDLIGAGYYSEKHKASVVVIGNPKASIVGDEVITNFDIILHANRSHPLQDDSSVSWTDIIGNRSVGIDRVSKAVMQPIMAKYAKNKNMSLFVPVKTYLSNTRMASKDHPELIFGGDLPKSYVIKSCHGAQGYGQIVIKDRDKISLQKLMDAIWKNDYSSLVSFADNHRDVVQLIGDGGRKTMEQINNQGCIAQEIIKNISAEYRILAVNNGDIHYITHRERKGGEYKQANGCNTPFREVRSLNYFIKDKKMVSEIKDMVKMICNKFGPLQSIDLFLTNDGRWGIFEFSNQFGVVGPGPKIVKDILVKLIDKQIDIFKKEQL